MQTLRQEAISAAAEETRKASVGACAKGKKLPLVPAKETGRLKSPFRWRRKSTARAGRRRRPSSDRRESAREVSARLGCLF
jgi:hypothetical protein